MNTAEWIEACPNMKAGTRVVSEATSLTRAKQGTIGTVVGKDPDYKGYYLIKWDGHKQNSSVAWDNVSVHEDK